MEKRIIIKNADGTVGILIPGKNTTRSIEEIAKKDIPAGASYKIVEASEVPPKDEYRGAWEVDADFKVKHNMNKARELHKEKIRKLREPKLAALDIEYQKADEEGDNNKKKDIAAKKKKLRDATKHSAIDAAQSIDQLKIAALNELDV